MLNLGRLNNLADALGLTPDFINQVLDDFDENPKSLVSELTLWRADSSKKPRDVIAVRKRWRLIQRRIYLKLLLPRFKPSRHSHGGVKGRSPVTNARVHLGNTFGFVADISGFFPAISCRRVNKLFLREACAPKVAAILTRLCTYDYHLALGLTTSPIIANEIFKPIDDRIWHACRKLNLAYSRFIDDITISGKQFDFRKSGIPATVKAIIERHGFSLAPDKTDCDRFDNGMSITGVRIKRDHLDPSKAFVEELDRTIKDHENLSLNLNFDGPLLLREELFGKAHYACAINPGRRRDILSRLKAINYSQMMDNAQTRGLVRFRDRLSPRDAPRPDATEPLRTAASLSSSWDESVLTDRENDPTIAPF